MRKKPKRIIKELMRKLNKYIEKPILFSSVDVVTYYQKQRWGKSTEKYVELKAPMMFKDMRDFNLFVKKISKYVRDAEGHEKTKIDFAFKKNGRRDKNKFVYTVRYDIYGWRDEELPYIFFEHNNSDATKRKLTVSKTTRKQGEFKTVSGKKRLDKGVKYETYIEKPPLKKELFDFSKPINLVILISSCFGLWGFQEGEFISTYVPIANNWDGEYQNFIRIYMKYFSDAYIGKVSWDSVGGLKKVKAILERDLIIKDEYEIFNDRLRPHILMVGSAGVGKSLLSKALLSRLQKHANIVPYTQMSALFCNADEGTGNTSGVESLFDFINGLSIDSGMWTYILIDEIDQMAKEDVTGKALLKVMDNTDKRKFSIIATTNRPDKLPFPFLRSGRFYPIFKISIPDEQERGEIWEIITRQHKLDISPEICNELAKMTENFTGADINEIAREIYDERDALLIDNLLDKGYSKPKINSLLKEKYCSLLKEVDFDIIDEVKKKITVMKKHNIDTRNTNWDKRVKSFVDESEASIMFL